MFDVFPQWEFDSHTGFFVFLLLILLWVYEEEFNSTACVAFGCLVDSEITGESSSEGIFFFLSFVYWDFVELLTVFFFMAFDHFVWLIGWEILGVLGFSFFPFAYSFSLLCG